LCHDAAASVPAYREFPREHGVDPAKVASTVDFDQLPMVTKDWYLAGIDCLSCAGLVRYDPSARYVQTSDSTLLVTGDRVTR
jgi:hypothetical protein